MTLPNDAVILSAVFGCGITDHTFFSFFNVCFSFAIIMMRKREIAVFLSPYKFCDSKCSMAHFLRLCGLVSSV